MIRRQDRGKTLSGASGAPGWRVVGVAVLLFSAHPTSAGAAMSGEFCRKHPYSPKCFPTTKGTISNWTNDGFPKSVDKHPSRIPLPQPPGPAGIVDTGYALLTKQGVELDGYGLYSYAIGTPENAKRTKMLVDAITRSTPDVTALELPRNRINVIYMPGAPGAPLAPAKGQAKAPASSQFNYDYKLARLIINQVCAGNLREVEAVCKGDMSQGPYLFTYATKIASAQNLEPPYLMADLSNVHEKAFSTIVSAFKTQIKEGPLGANEKLSNLSLTILNLTLTAGDLINPVKSAIADIIHAELNPSADKSGDKGEDNK